MSGENAEHLISECKQIKDDCEYTAEAHHFIAGYQEIINYVVKLAPAIIAAWSGIQVLRGASTQIAWLAIISGVVFAVATILGPERWAAEHTKAAKDYTVLKHEARSLHEAFYPEMSQSEFYIAVRILREKYNSLVTHTPKTNNMAFKIAQKRIREDRHKPDYRES